MNQIINWYEINYELLRRTLKSPITHSHDNTWVRIEQFPLPKHYNKAFTKLLITQPGNAGISNQSKYNFYLCRDLSRTDGLRMVHYFDNDRYNNFKNKGYARLSFHLKSFHPSINVLEGDTLLDICQSVYNFLAQRQGV